MENENAIQGVTARKTERKSGRDRERERAESPHLQLEGQLKLREV